jgi:hypothetical protein
MFQLMVGENVVDFEGPLNADRHLKNCALCGQIAFRVLHVKSDDGQQREIALCGAHFNEACAMYPEVRRMAALRPAV